MNCINLYLHPFPGCEPLAALITIEVQSFLGVLHPCALSSKVNPAIFIFNSYRTMLIYTRSSIFLTLSVTWSKMIWDTLYNSTWDVPCSDGPSQSCHRWCTLSPSSSSSRSCSSDPPVEDFVQVWQVSTNYVSKMFWWKWIWHLEVETLLHSPCMQWG